MYLFKISFSIFFSMGTGLAAPSPNPSPSNSAQLQTSHISPSGGARPGRARSYDLVKKPPTWCPTWL